MCSHEAVTVGDVATEYAQSYAAHRYTDYLYFHGLAVQMAEALAEWVHGFGGSWGLLVRVGIWDILAQRYRGSRYSFGYPACPNIRIRLQLLGYWGDRINLHMDESEQLSQNSLRLRHTLS